MPAAPRRIRLRRADACAGCASPLVVGDLATWDPSRREVRCLECPGASQAPAAFDSTAGASARREYEGQRQRREQRIRDRYGPLGGIAVALTGQPAHEHAWAKGAAGEEKLAAKLARGTADAGVVLLHDRRVPGSKANIDHLAVGPAGVFVIDAKRYNGRIRVERRGGLLAPRTDHLVVGGRDRSKLVEGLLRQVEVVERQLVGEHEVPVRGLLCFVDGDWPWFGSLEVRGVPVLPPPKAARLCAAGGPLDPDRVNRIANLLAARLVAA